MNSILDQMDDGTGLDDSLLMDDSDEADDQVRMSTEGLPSPSLTKANKDYLKVKLKRLTLRASKAEVALQEALKTIDETRSNAIKHEELACE